MRDDPVIPFPALLLTTLLRSLVMLLLLSAVACAASLQFDLYPDLLQDQPGALQAGVQLNDLLVQGGRASVGVAWSEGLSASLYLRQTTSLGPAGNVILELQAGGSTSGSYGSYLTARGVAGPLAVRLRVSALNDPALLLAGPPGSVFPVPPRLSGARAGLELGATWRTSATLLLDMDASVFTAEVTGYLMAIEARLLRQAGSHDLILGFDGYLQTGGDGPAGSAALRVGRQFNQRRAAPWQASLLFGAGPGYVGPGFRVSGARQFSLAELKLVAAAEFYRFAVAPLQLSVQWQQPLGESGSSLTSSAELDWNTASGVSARVRVSYRVPLDW